MLEIKVLFTIPLFGGIPVSESVVVTWIIMAIMVLLAIIFVRKLETVPTGKQNVAEMIVELIYNMLSGMLGPKGRRYVPYLGTVFLFLIFSNTITGVFGFRPPTKNLNVTAALAIISIVLVQFSAIYAKGVKGWLGNFLHPMKGMLPINLMELLIRPLSLCMRLFGNILGAFILMEILKSFVPVGIPAVMSLYFDFFDGILQAYIFVFLTSIFIGEGLESAHE
ncbi:MAG: F0F1 ATP synthase subunit A [Oscillospiraceae bacterium]